MKIEIVEAILEDKPVIQNLARFYIYDLSEYQKRKCPDDGLYEDEDYIRFWSEQGKYCYLVKCDDELAGFVFVQEEGSSENIDYEISEFFILRKFRGTCVAQYTAKAIFDKFHGNWEVMAISGNLPAEKFWDRVINDYTKGSYSKALETHDVPMEVIRFSNK